MRVLTLVLLLALSTATQAFCPKHQLSDPGRVKLKGDRLMIVTHGTSFHDSRLATKRGIDEAVLYAKNHKIPIVYLQDETPPQFYFMQDCEPDYWVRSEGGELGFEIEANHVYIVGGHLELCLSVTVHDVLQSWAKQKKSKVTLTYLMDGIYSNGKNLDRDAPYYRDFEKFMSVVTYRRPGGEHWPKLTLLETLGVIREEADELKYIKDILPHYDRTMAGYRVELTMNDSVVKLLQSSKVGGWTPPTIRFEFLDSAIDLSEDRPER
jgi:hypothetical protein